MPMRRTTSASCTTNEDHLAWQRAIDAVTGAMVLLHEEAQPPRTEGTIHVSASSQAFQMEDPA